MMNDWWMLFIILHGWCQLLMGIKFHLNFSPFFFHLLYVNFGSYTKYLISFFCFKAGSMEAWIGCAKSGWKMQSEVSIFGARRISWALRTVPWTTFGLLSILYLQREMWSVPPCHLQQVRRCLRASNVICFVDSISRIQCRLRPLSWVPLDSKLFWIVSVLLLRFYLVNALLYEWIGFERGHEERVR